MKPDKVRDLRAEEVKYWGAGWRGKDRKQVDGLKERYVFEGGLLDCSGLNQWISV